MRLIECHFAYRPRLGKSKLPSQDPVRLGQDPELAFSATALAAFKEDGKGLPHRLAVRFFGMFGPNGCLPLHLTEHALRRLSRRPSDSAFARFVDVFHHRMYSLFYRAWAKSQPVISLDRWRGGESGLVDTGVMAYADYVGALCGIGSPAFKGTDLMPYSAKLYFSGLLACQAKPPAGLCAIIGGFFGLPVDVREFVGEWMRIADEDRTRLGGSNRVAFLGESAVLGERVWGCQHKFRIVLGPLGLQQYLSLLPGERQLSQLVAIVRAYIGDELAWDINLVLMGQEVPQELILGRINSDGRRTPCLDGSSRLGWTCWMGGRDPRRDADDLLLSPRLESALRTAGHPDYTNSI
jgi:type VI secretion system protein ImpH